MVSDRLVWIFQKLLVYWHFPTQQSLGFKEYGLKKIKCPVNYCQLKTGNRGYSTHGLNKTGQQRTGKNITYSDESQFWLQHAQVKVRIWCKECKSRQSHPCINRSSCWLSNGLQSHQISTQWYKRIRSWMASLESARCVLTNRLLSVSHLHQEYLRIH